VVTIPHGIDRERLVTRTVHESSLYGQRTQYSFAVGMLFVGPVNNILIFDVFDLIEYSHDLVAISKLNSHAVAKYVSF